MTDDELRAWLQAALPPVDGGTDSGNRWQRVMARLDEPPRWSLVDLGLAVAVVIVLAIFPEWLWMVAYHL